MATRSRRMLSKSISTSTKVHDPRRSLEARLLFTWMISHADDEGRLDGNAGTVKATVVPMMDWTTDFVEELILNLASGASNREENDRRLIYYYGLSGHKVIAIRGWDKFQTFHGVQKEPSSFPAPPNPKWLTSQPGTVPKRRKGKRREEKVREGIDWATSLKIIELWNSLSFVKKPISLSLSRHDKIILRNAELVKTNASWQDLIAAVEEQPFTHGKNKHKWKASFDWLVKNDTNWRKVIERAYASAKESDEPEAWDILRESLEEK